MVYNAKTYQAYHPLTEVGKERYRVILEKAADEILFKHDHPIRYYTMKLVEFIKFW